MKLTEEFEQLLDQLIDKKLELINKRKELHSLHDTFQNVKNNGIGAKDFRKVESEIEILLDEVEVLYLQKLKLKNSFDINTLDEDMLKDFTVDTDYLDEEG